MVYDTTGNGIMYSSRNITTVYDIIILHYDTFTCIRGLLAFRQQSSLLKYIRFIVIKYSK